MMNGHGKSDRPIVPGKSPNQAGGAAAEETEGRGLAKGNLEFGRFPARDREKLGQGKPETFGFLGFTHICGKTSRGRFAVLRQTIRKRLLAKLSQVKAELERRMHDPLPEVGQWLKAVVGGHFRYYGVPTNRHALNRFRLAVGDLWHHVLSRRSQIGHVRWQRMKRLIDHWLPPARIYHPYPTCRMRVTT